MDKRLTYVRRKLPSTVLYFDDLLEIADLLETENDKVQIKLENSSHVYEFYSSEEFKNFKEPNIEQFHDIEVNSNGEKIYLNLRLRVFEADIYISEHSSIGRGLLEKVSTIVTNRKKPLGWLYTNPFFIGIPIFLVLLMLEKGTYLMSLFVLSLAILWIFCAYKLTFEQYSTLYLKKRNQMPSFFERRKDEIVIAIISATLGALFTLFMTKIM